MTVAATTRILVCDDHALFRDGVRSVLSAVPSLEVVAEAENGRDAVTIARRVRPDIVLMDFDLPEMSGLDATRRIVGSGCGARVVMLTLYDDEEIVALCIEAGATGYVLKDGPSNELLLAIDAVQRGHKYLTPRALTKIVAYNGGGKQVRTRYDLLTEREREVLKLLADGFSVKEIAARLRLSVKTVDVHKTNLMRKLDIHDRATLVKYAIQRKLIRVPVVRGLP